MSTRAFCPGHITGFFLPSGFDTKIEHIGSRGAGFSIELGVTADVHVGGKDWKIAIDGKRQSITVVEKTVSNFAKGGTVDLQTKIPFSQGFGMSGACALSAGLAAAEEVGRERKDAVKAAHMAEIFCRTGLGDVVAQSIGGFETRIKEGLPPFGEIKKTEIDMEVVIGIMGSVLITPDVLRDPSMSEWIKIIGEECMDEFLPDDGFDEFLDLSYKFATETRFLRDDMIHFFSETKDIGKGSMSMIGNSIFMVGNIKEIENLLVNRVGENNVFVTKIDNQGARLMD